MMKFVILFLQIAAVGGGLFLGYALKPASAPTEHAAEDGNGKKDKAHKKGGHDDHGDKKSKKKKKKKKDSHGKGHGGGHGESSSGFGYIKFGRQFIVPVIKNEAVGSLVVIDINLEVPSSSAENVYPKEPRLRDLLLRDLLEMSNRGVFDKDFLREGNLDEIRGDLLLTMQSILGDDVNDVLILSISRQDL